MESIHKWNKKGGIVTSTIMGVGALIIGVIVTLVIVSTLQSANLLTAGSTEDDAVTNLTSNFTVGIGNVATRIPTILLIVAVVFLFGALVLLVRQSKIMGIGGGGGV